MINYVAPPSASSGLSLMPTSDSREQRSLEFFRTRTVPELAGSFDSELWSKFIMRTAFHEPAVRHALVALGSLHESFEVAVDPYATDSKFGLRQYSKAIQCVVESSVPFAGQTTDVALISCILFTAFESLQGHYRSALTHINSGLKVLEEREAQGDVQHESYVPRDLLQALFIRLDTQAMEIGDTSLRPSTEQLRQTNDIPTVFTTLETAQRSLDQILNNLVHFMQSAESVYREDQPLPPPILDSIRQGHAGLVKVYHAWCAAFDAYLTNNHMGTTSPISVLRSQSHPGVLILQIWRIIIRLIVYIDLHAGELAFDEFIEDFRMVVELAEAFIRQTAVPSQAAEPKLKRAMFTNSKVLYKLGSSSSRDLALLRKDLGCGRRGSDKSDLSHGFLGIQPDATPLVLPHRAASPAFAHAASPSDSWSSSESPESSFSGTTDPSVIDKPVPTSPRSKSGLKPTFSLSLGLITPLYMTASRCRDPTIRRRALHLLHTCNRKEGIWDSSLAALVAQRIVEIEEAGALPLGYTGGFAYPVNGTVVVLSASQIPDTARLREMETFFYSERHGKIRYRKSTGSAETEADGNLLEHYEELMSW